MTITHDSPMNYNAFEPSAQHLKVSWSLKTNKIKAILGLALTRLFICNPRLEMFECKIKVNHDFLFIKISRTVVFSVFFFF